MEAFTSMSRKLEGEVGGLQLAQTSTELRALLWEEVCELCEAVDRHEPTSRIVAEAGDVVWCVAMVVDAIASQRESGR